MLRLIFSFFLLALWGCAGAWAQDVEDISIQAPIRINQAFDGGEADDDSLSSALAANGKVVVFASSATNLIADDNNGLSDIFVVDIREDAAGQQGLDIKRINVGESFYDQSGQEVIEESDGASFRPDLSLVGANGEYLVAFESLATKLTHYNAKNPNRIIDYPYGNYRNIFVSIVEEEMGVELITFPRGPKGFPIYDESTGMPLALDGDCVLPSITLMQSNPREARVAFACDATNLVEGDTNGVRDVFVARLVEFKDPEKEDPDVAIPAEFYKNLKVRRIMENPVWGPGLESLEGGLFLTNRPKISGDGRFVAFEMYLPSYGRQIMLYEIKSRKISLVSKSFNGTSFANDDSRLMDISFSGADILYYTSATNIISDAQTASVNLMLYNRKDNLTRRVNVSYPAKEVGNGTQSALTAASLSADGRLVVFAENSTNLVDAADTNAEPDVFLKDMKTKKIWRVTGLNSNEVNGASSWPSVASQKFNAKKGFIAYTSSADNLISGDANAASDIFLSAIEVPPPAFIPEQTEPEATSNMGKDSKLIEQMLTLGSFPEPFLSQSEKNAKRWRKSYSNLVLTQDVVQLEDVKDLSALELLVDILRRSVGSSVSFSSIARDLEISPNTVKRYIEILERMYLIFRVTPYHRNIPRAILKEPKIYFFDIGMIIGDKGAKFKNLVALHILKHLHYLEDTQGITTRLHYIRDKQGKEVDFYYIEDIESKESDHLVEVKLSEKTPSKQLFYFQQLLNTKASLVSLNARKTINSSKIKTFKAETFFDSLSC